MYARFQDVYFPNPGLAIGIMFDLAHPHYQGFQSVLRYRHSPILERVMYHGSRYIVSDLKRRGIKDISQWVSKVLTGHFPYV